MDSLGVVMYIKLYAGARRQDGVEHGLATSVVRDVLETLRCEGHWMFTDNFYGNFDTLDACIEKGQYCILMLRRPRKLKAGSQAGVDDIVRLLCQAVSQKGTVRGTKLVAYFDNRCMVVAWKDNKVVPILTNICADDAPVFVRRAAKGGVIVIPSTQAVILYNAYKSVVDRFNGKKAEADIITKLRRWWVRTFTNCPMVVCENNAWRSSVWHNITPQARHRPFWQHRMECADYLIMPYKLEREPPELPLIVQRRHSMKAIRDVLVGKKTARCVYCRTKSNCSYMCKLCLNYAHWECSKKHPFCHPAKK